MKRNSIVPRAGWQQIVRDLGLEWHTVQGENGLPERYWNEEAYYELTGAEVDAIERASAELFQLCLGAVQHVIDEDRFADLAIPRALVPLIVKSWNDEPPALYGRFDFSLQGGIPKMLELNGDTPTSLLEASIIQWAWKEQRFPELDQFNSLHEKLIAKWRDVGPYLNGHRVHFAAADSVEDLWTIAYLAHTARQAGLTVQQLQMLELGWNEVAGEFRDGDDRRIGTCFKLYPWEWMVTESFFQHVARSNTMWIEPIWKMLLSNKGILAILWELNPDHPNLLRTTFDAPPEDMWGWAKKPLLSREGAGVTIKTAESFVAASPDLGYGEEGYVFQELAPLPDFPETVGVANTAKHNYAVIGSWVIDGQPAGVGIRESDGLITGNTSRFVPHVIKG